MKKDYYKILGISESEKSLHGKDFEKLIKPKYRKLAMQYHPDKQQGKSDSEKKEAEEKFKEISEAYDVLSNEEKREQYDNPSFGNDFNMDDFMNPFGGFNFHFHENTIKKGTSQRIRLTISINDVLNGGKRTIKYKRFDKCESCNGSGMSEHSKIVDCPHCGGTGQLFQRNGVWQQISTCPYCNGKGSTISNPCEKCKGSGVIEKYNEVEVTIPKGINESQQLVFRGLGNAPLNGDGEYGDLIILFQDESNDEYKRNGDDVYKIINLNVVDVMLGCVKNIETIDGTVVSTKISKGIENGTQLRFSRKGLPNFSNNEHRGDMIGVINYIVPKELNSREIELLNQLKECDNFK